MLEVARACFPIAGRRKIGRWIRRKFNQGLVQDKFGHDLRHIMLCNEQRKRGERLEAREEEEADTWPRTKGRRTGGKLKEGSCKTKFDDSLQCMVLGERRGRGASSNRRPGGEEGRRGEEEQEEAEDAKETQVGRKPLADPIK